MQVQTFPSSAAASLEAAQWVADQVQNQPGLRVGLPTGQSPLGLYERWAAWQQNGEADFQTLQGYGLDEYLGLAASDEASFAHFLNRHVATPLGLAKHQIRTLDGRSKDPEGACAELEAHLAEVGGLDLLLLGIGTNGHIAFNEPGSERSSRTRVVALDPATRRANANAFGGQWEQVPSACLTMGIATLLEAKQILVLAFGASKVPALRAMLHGPQTVACPASFLQEHPSVRIFLDPGAAQALEGSQEPSKQLPRKPE